MQRLQRLLLRRRDIVSRTVAAVMCEADAPCSVNTASPTVSSFTVSPHRTNRPSSKLWVLQITTVQERCEVYWSVFRIRFGDYRTSASTMRAVQSCDVRFHIDSTL